MAPHPALFERDARAAQAFVSWGRSGSVTVQRATTFAQGDQLIQPTTPTPATWTLLLTATSTAATLAGVNAAVLFTILVGVGSTIVPIKRTINLTAATPESDLVVPFLPAGTITVVPSVTASIAAPRDMQITVAALATPLAPASFTTQGIVNGGT
jgi:hypothetical protein